jgi:RNA methyltransferase, TrmH family
MITSTGNERIKTVRKLHSGQHRRRTGRLLIEGVRLVSDALQSGLDPDEVFYAPDLVSHSTDSEELLDRLRDRAIPCTTVSPPVLASLSQTVTPQGIVAVVQAPRLPVPQHLTLVLLLDGVSDPGNAGTLLRSAEAAGAEFVLFGPGSVDPFNDKVLRAGMGTHFRLPLSSCSTWEETVSHLREGIELYVAETSAAISYDEVDWTRPAVLIVGSEAHGPSAEARSAATAISIPMHGPVDSLNAAMAGTIILFEAARQRTRYVQARR